jgi:dihydroorotate dehydrogenase
VSDVDLSASVGGLVLPFCVMNAAGTATTAGELRGLVRSRSGAIVLRTTTVHPFVHPEFRSLHNPGFDKLMPLVREMVDVEGRTVIASIAGSTVEELVQLARAFASAGAAAVEVNLAEPWVEATLAPLEGPEQLTHFANTLVRASEAPVWVRLPDRAMRYDPIGPMLVEAGIGALVVRNEFTEFEKLRLAVGDSIDLVPTGPFHSGYDVARTLAKGAPAVQLGPVLGSEGMAVFARLERELRTARGARPES